MMYNKLFTKILDSSIWLAPDPTRLVWITLIAVMDEDGNAMFACVDNLAIRARVTVEQAEAAVRAFEAPDPKSGDPDNDGRRIERFPGGWHVLNAHKYRAMVTKTIIREQTRVRTARWRAKQSVTQSDAHVTHSNENVTPSEAVSEAVSISEAERQGEVARAPRSARATRLPADFELTEQRRAIAQKEGAEPEREFARFTDHWRAASGANARKHDWDAAWRNWCRKALDMKPRANGAARRVYRDAPTTAELEALEASRAGK